MALGHLAWAAVTIEAREHAAALRRLLATYAGQLAVTGTGLIVHGRRSTACSPGSPTSRATTTRPTRCSPPRWPRRSAMGSAPLAARTRHWWGRARLRRGDRAGAAPLLAASRATAEELAMSGTARPARRPRRRAVTAPG